MKLAVCQPRSEHDGGHGGGGGRAGSEVDFAAAATLRRRAGRGQAGHDEHADGGELEGMKRGWVLVPHADARQLMRVRMPSVRGTASSRACRCR